MDSTKTKIDAIPSRSSEDWTRNMRMILGSRKWDFSVIRHLVSRNPSLINVAKFNYKTLLEVMVTDDRGTEDGVRFLIERGADVNLGSGRLLLDAFRFCRGRPGIVKILIESGVVIKDDYRGTSALSEAISAGFEVDVLRMIVAGGVDVNHVNRCGQTPLCRALARERAFEVIQFLLDSGARADVCKCHQTPLHCLYSSKNTITTKIVELFLKKGADGGNIIVDKDLERTVLHDTLRYSTYEERAMCILIQKEIGDIDARDSTDSTYLHDALFNSGCTLGVVKCLVEKGAKVHTVDRLGETPLHKALLTRPCDIEIVRYLLQKGSPVNVPNRFDETATVVAVKKRQSLSVIRLLMASGERVSQSQWSSLSVAFRHFAMDRSVDNIARFQTLLKYAFLEDPGIEIGDMIAIDGTRCDFPHMWYLFWQGCLKEAKNLKRFRAKNGVPLLNVLGYGTRPEMKNSYESLSDKESESIVLLLKYNIFPLYAGILKAKLGSEFLIEAFATIRLGAFYKDGDNEKISVLTSPCLEYIGKFLSRDEKIFMILHLHEMSFPKVRNRE